MIYDISEGLLDGWLYKEAEVFERGREDLGIWSLLMMGFGRWVGGSYVVMHIRWFCETLFSGAD